VVKEGDVVKVRVKEVDVARKRIGPDRVLAALLNAVLRLGRRTTLLLAR
jgi:hypothetical protein